MLKSKFFFLVEKDIQTTLQYVEYSTCIFIAYDTFDRANEF